MRLRKFFNNENFPIYASLMPRPFQHVQEGQGTRLEGICDFLYYCPGSPQGWGRNCETNALSIPTVVPRRGGWGISLIGVLLDHRHSRHAFSRSKYMHRGCGTAHAQIRCHPATKSKVRPKKKYAHLGELQFEFLELSDQFEHQVKAVKGHGDKPVSIQRHLCH